MDITINVPGGHGQAAEIAAGPGGGEAAVDLGGGQKQAAQVQAGQRERQPGVEIEMEAGQ